VLEGKRTQSVEEHAAELRGWEPSRRDSELAEYLRQVKAKPAPTARQEIETAQRLETLELRYWETLLAHPPAHALIEAAVARALPDLDCKLSERLAAAASAEFAESACVLSALAREVHAADLDRVAVKTAHESVAASAGELSNGAGLASAAVADYLRAVEHARATQQRYKNTIVSAQLRLVVAIAGRYRFGQLSFGDLVQEGNLGLIKAVERFDHRLGFRFSTYASWWVRHAIKRAVADKSRTVRIPVHLIETRTIINRMRRVLAAREGAAPTTRQLADATGIPEEKVALVEVVPETRLSLDVPVNGADGTSFKDLLEDPHASDPLDRMSIEAWLEWLPSWTDLLTPMELQILRWRFGLDDTPELTLREIGDRYNLSRERVRQLQERALDKIRRQISRQHGITPSHQEC